MKKIPVFALERPESRPPSPYQSVFGADAVFAELFVTEARPGSLLNAPQAWLNERGPIVNETKILGNVLLWPYRDCKGVNVLNVQASALQMLYSLGIMMQYTA